MKYFNLNENLEIVYLGDYPDIQTADNANDDSEQIVIISFEELIFWKSDLKKIQNTEKNSKFIFELSKELIWKIVTPFSNGKEDFENALDDSDSIWVLYGEESFITLQAEVEKYTQEI